MQGSDESLPGSRWKHCLQFADASVHWDEELDVVEGCGGGHGISVVFVVYSEVCAGGFTAPASGQAQRSRLEALR